MRVTARIVFMPCSAGASIASPRTLPISAYRWWHSTLPLRSEDRMESVTQPPKAGVVCLAMRLGGELRGRLLESRLRPENLPLADYFPRSPAISTDPQQP